MLYETYHLELDYDRIIEEAVEIEKTATDLDYVSNKNGGVQIHERNWVDIKKDLYIESYMIPSISRLISTIEDHQVVLYTWLNINYPGSYNSAHTHAGTKRSGIIYIKTPEDCGNLIFTEAEEEVIPRPGLIITFNSDTRHAVSPNFSNDTRISFAFNY